MNVFFFPINPFRSNGYSIAVKNDLSKLQIDQNDLIVWYEYTNDTFYGNDVVLLRPPKFAISRIVKVLQNHINCEVTAGDLKQLDLKQVIDVFCGDVIFYRAVRELFPTKRITVRFHNCFARMKITTISMAEASLTGNISTPKLRLCAEWTAGADSVNRSIPICQITAQTIIAKAMPGNIPGLCLTISRDWRSVLHQRAISMPG